MSDSIINILDVQLSKHKNIAIEIEVFGYGV